MVKCPSCSATVPNGKFCAECGGGLAPKPKFCPNCGFQNGVGSRFCSNCGTGMAE
jgi:predicted amidophosphoribosyltransferase